MCVLPTRGSPFCRSGLRIRTCFSYGFRCTIHMLHPLQSVISRNLLWPLLPPCSEIETERASARVGAFARKGKINRFHRVQALSKLSLWLAGPSFSSEVWSSPFPRGASFPPSSPGFPVCCPRSSLLLAFAGLPFSSQLGLSLFRWLRPPPLCSTPHASY